MEMTERLLALCKDEKDVLRPKNECRALMINELILVDGMGVDDAEDVADKALNESGFWEIPQFESYPLDEDFQA